jgi:opacity protein-like surface antigen
MPTKLLSFCASCLFSANLLAFPYLPASVHPFLSVTGGYSVVQSPSSNQQFVFSDNSFYTLRTNSSVYHEGISGLFVGAEWRYRPEYSMQLGVSYYQPSTFTVNGTDTQGIINSPATFDTYAYQYTLNMRQLLLEGKWLYNWKELFHPYITLGLGGAYNTAYQYGINNPVFLAFAPQFANNSTASFSYRVGLGLDVTATDNLRVGIGYRYADFGKAQLGNGAIDTIATPGSLQQTHIYVNEVVAELTLMA